MWTCIECGGLTPIGTVEACLHCDHPLPRRTSWALRLTALLGPAGALLLAACYGAPGRYQSYPAPDPYGRAPAAVSDDDRDVDGVAAGADCVDEDRSRYPGAPDTAGDGIDQNCDGVDGVKAPASPPSTIAAPPNP